MPLTTKDFKQFAQSAVRDHSDVRNARTPELKARYIRAHRLAARAYWTSAQEEVAGSGYQVTQRVKDILWAELTRIADEEEAASMPMAA
jgi:hypothetical protein